MIQGEIQVSRLLHSIWTQVKGENIPSLKLTAKAPENRPFAPKGNEKVFQPSIFRGKLAVSFREGKIFELPPPGLKKTVQRSGLQASLKHIFQPWWVHSPPPLPPVFFSDRKQSTRFFQPKTETNPSTETGGIFSHPKKFWKIFPWKSLATIFYRLVSEQPLF